ncbi:NACHT domain-containing protein [Laspinema palackyanum]|uniref:NACHT domain-containing protein n=1 Tax=Laspinema palackyanum TaxID=3231601 RepID=UPI00349FA420
MDVGRSLVKLIVGGSCVLGSLALASGLSGAGLVFSTALGSVAAGNTANAIDALLDGGEGGVSLENQDLTKAVGKAIAAVITLAAKSQRGKTRQHLEKIAAQAKDNWVKIAQQELTQQRYPELREAQLDQFLTPQEYQLTLQGNLTDTEWGDIFIRLNMAACKGGGFPIPSEVRQQVAELLHTTFPKALRETLKEDFAKDGKAFAGLTLQLLTGMQAQLRQRQANPGGVNVEEFSQILQQFQELETQLRGSVTQQQEFFREVSRGIESGFAEVCQRLGVMETTITELLQTLEERLVELRQEVTEFRQEVRQGLEALHNQPGGRQLSKQEYRNRQNILTQMRTEVESRLTQSIHRAAFVNLGKEQQPQQVQRPWDMSVKVGEQRSVQLPPQTTILDVFDNPTISGKFLILGKPGGGKTTTLLELAEALIERAERDSDAPIPVILELSTWQEVTKRKFLPFGEPEKYDPSIKEWVLSQLASKGVSQDIGEQWLREKELVLLLDGLDELQPERQGKCVRAINQFLGSEFSPLHLVVCSRKEEYEVYEEMLQLNGAICLEDLTNEQILNYFTSVNLGEFWESIKGSEKIVNFIRQPLFLAVTSLAYEQMDVEEWRNCNTEERAIDYLLGVYRLNRIGKEKKFAIGTQNYLRTIAIFLNKESNFYKTSKDESLRYGFHYLSLINPSIIDIAKKSNFSFCVDIFYMILFGVFILFSHSLMFAPNFSVAYISDFMSLLTEANFLSLHWLSSIIGLFILALLSSIIFIIIHFFSTAGASTLAFPILVSPLGFLLPMSFFGSRGNTDYDRDYELPKRTMEDHRVYLYEYLLCPIITTGLFIFISIFKIAEILFNHFFSRQASTSLTDLISFAYLWLVIIIPFWILIRIRLTLYELIGKFISGNTYFERLIFHALMMILMGLSSFLIGFICCQFLMFLGLLENTIIVNITIYLVILPAIAVLNQLEQI